MISEACPTLRAAALVAPVLLATAWLVPGAAYSAPEDDAPAQDAADVAASRADALPPGCPASGLHAQQALHSRRAAEGQARKQVRDRHPATGWDAEEGFNLGGFGTLRGFKTKRFIGDSAVLLGGELRTFLTEWTLWGQHLRPGAALFAEAGRSFDGVDLHFRNWRAGYGGGLRLAWNLATIVSFDLGVSREDTIFYMELGTAF